MKALADGTPKYKYMFETVSNLVRAWRNGEARSPYLTEAVPFPGLVQQEKDLFFPDHKFLKMPFNSAKKNKAIKALCSAYAHYTWSDKDSFGELLLALQLGMAEYDHTEIKPYLTMFYYLLNKPGGDRSEARFERTMTVFLECLEHNQVFYRYMETAFEFIFKLAAAVPAVSAWFVQNKDKWAWLYEWATTVSFPLSTMEHSNQVRLLKKRNNYQQFPQYLKNEAFRNSFLQSARIERVKYLMDGRPTAMPLELEQSLVELEDYKFKIGEQFEIYNKKTDTSQVVEVVDILDEMLRVKYLNYNPSDQYG